MPKPPTELTGAQHEIVQLLWEQTDPLSVTEVWQILDRPVARTTVLTWIQRLEKRGWLTRVEDETGLRYRANRAPGDAAANAAVRIVDSLFGGSPSGLMMALAGRGKIAPEEVARLRRLVEELEAESE